MNVEISKIEVGERLRSRLDPIKLRQLADDMDRNGQLQEIVVLINWATNARGSTYVERATLIAGYRRLEAAKLLGWKTIRCVWQFDGEVDADNEIDRLRMEYSENELRENFTEMERVAFGVKIKERIAAEARERMLSGKRLDYEYNPETGYKVWRGDDEETAADTTATTNAEECYPAMPNVAANTDPSAKSCQGLDGTLQYTGGKASAFVAKRIGMGDEKFRQGEYVLKNASDEQIAAIDSGKASINAVYNELKPKPVTAHLFSLRDSVTDEPVSQALYTARPERGNEEKPEDPLSTKDYEPTRNDTKFDPIPSSDQIGELRQLLKEARARAADAESKLEREMELRQMEMSHYTSTIDMLKNQLDRANARITELEGKYEPDKHSA